MEMEQYVRSCQKRFWREILDAELEYIARRLSKGAEVLSVGCGPALIEKGLSSRGFRITGMDVSRQALALAPDNIRTVLGRAEDIPFAKDSFDAVIYVASLQFVDDYRKAVAEAARVLRPSGTLLALLLNPESDFFIQKFKQPHSYVQKTKHRNLDTIEEAIGLYFDFKTEYFLGVKDDNIFESSKAAEAALYIINAVPR